MSGTRAGPLLLRSVFGSCLVHEATVMLLLLKRQVSKRLCVFGERSVKVSSIGSLIVIVGRKCFESINRGWASSL